MNWNKILSGACDYWMNKNTDKFTYNFFFKMKQDFKGGN